MTLLWRTMPDMIKGYYDLRAKAGASDLYLCRSFKRMKELHFQQLSFSSEKIGNYVTSEDLGSFFSLVTVLYLLMPSDYFMISIHKPVQHLHTRSRKVFLNQNCSAKDFLSPKPIFQAANLHLHYMDYPWE